MVNNSSHHSVSGLSLGFCDITPMVDDGGTIYEHPVSILN